jgi:hypothetical protein
VLPGPEELAAGTDDRFGDAAGDLVDARVAVAVGDGGGVDAPHTEASVVAGGGGCVAPVSPEPQLHPSTSPSWIGAEPAPEPDHTHPPPSPPSQKPQ